MSEEVAQVESSQTAPEVTPDSNAEVFSKMQSGNETNAFESVKAEPKTEDKATVAPEAKADDKATVKAPEVKKDEPKPTFDPTEINWLQSKGIDATKFDPTNEAVKALIKNARNAESEGSKLAQSIKAKEIAEQAKTVKDPSKEQATVKKTKIQEYDDFHKTVGDYSANMFGYESMDALVQANPEIALKVQQEYIEGRQRAWEADREAKEAEIKQANEETESKQRFLSEYETSKVEMSNNILKLKSVDPDIESNLEKTGINAFLDKLEQDASWPKSFVLSNPKTAEWLGKAAKAIITVENMPKLKEEWKQEYEKSLKEQKKAILPNSGSNDNSDVEAEFAKKIQKKPSGF